MSNKISKISVLLGAVLLAFNFSASALSPNSEGAAARHHGIPDQAVSITESPPVAAIENESSDGSANIGLMAAAAAACDTNAFATNNSNTLINQIKTQGAECVNDLFNADSSVQVSAFSSNNMTAVASHTENLAGSYSGNGDNDLEALYLFLRAGYYAEYYNDGIAFTSSVTPAVKDAIDAFVTSGYFYSNNEEHARVLREVIIAMDSSEQQHVYLHVVKEWLNRWDESYGDNYNMRGAVNGIFTILYRGQWNDDFPSVVGNDTTLVSRLRSFSKKTWMIGHDAEFMIANAGRELGRLKVYEGAAIQSSVDDALNDIFSTYEMYGYGDAVWLAAAGTASYHGNCADYDICGYGEELEPLALSQTHNCSSTIKIRSQNLTSTQTGSACQAMGQEETYFHNKLQTGQQPIPGDQNTQLQVNVFNSDKDYGKYGGPIFNIDTNNGGIYLEGDPSVSGNIPNFVAYEANYANPDHYVWNLEHEYVHYLDGRFNLAGGFSAPTAKVVWWAEGLAEYISKQDNNQAAYDTIHDGSTYDLATIFDTTYDGFVVDRIYRWGYLAVRFMFEKHLNEVLAMREETRAGDWSAYQSRVNSWANSYSNEFDAWTQTVENPGGGSSSGGSSSGGSSSGGSSSGGSSSGGSSSGGSSSGGNELQNGVSVNGLSASTGNDVVYTIDVPSGASNLVIKIEGGSGDADLYTRVGAVPTDSNYECRPYAGGNSETCTEPNPSSGTWYARVKAYDSFSNVTLTASYDGGGSSSGGSSSGGSSSGGSSSGGSSSGGSSSGGNQLQNGVPVNGLSASTGNDVVYSINVPSGASNLVIKISGGSGDADLYTQAGSVPTDSSYVCRPYAGGNSETCTEPNPTAGTWYARVKAYESFSNVTLTASYEGGGSSSGGSSSGGSSSGGSSSGGSSSGGSSSGGSSSGGNQLQNGVPVNGLSASTGNDVVYSINVPSGASNLVIKISGGSGDADLYTRAGAVPTDSSYACRPYASGNNETCTEPNPSSGTWYARVKAYDSFGGVTLTASYDGGGSSSGGSSSGGSSSGGSSSGGSSSSSSGGSSSGGGLADACASEAPHSGNGVTAGDTICVPNGSSGSSTQYFWVYVPSNTGSMVIKTEHGSGNGNLYYKASTWANSGNADQSSTNSGNTESITVNNPASGYRYISVVGQQSGMSLRVDFN